MEKKQKTLLEIFAQGADYALYRFFFGKIQVSLTIKKLVCMHFYGPPDSGRLGA